MMLQKIVSIDNTRLEQSRTEKQAEQDRRFQEEQDRVRDIADRQISIVRKGKVVNTIIPDTDKEAFIEANFYNAGDPKYPGLSKVDIDYMNLPEESKLLIRYLIHKGGDLSKLVTQRAATMKVSQSFKIGGSRMSGGTHSNVTGRDNDDTLESPGT